MIPFCVGRLLGVAKYADQGEIKTAYRKLALQLHPDVSDAADATERFAELSNVYGMLILLLVRWQLCSQ